MTGLLLDGWYGKRNTGDDAFCVVGALMYGRCLPRSRVAVLADARGAPELPAGARVEAYRTGFRGRQRAHSLLAAVRSGTVVHLGGSRFDRPTTNVMRDQAALARVGGVQLHAQAVSIGPFAQPSDAEMQAEFLSQFTSISVRDTASLRRGTDIGLDNVVQTFDVAVLLPRLTGIREHAPGDLARRRADDYPSGPVVGVALRDPDACDREDPNVAAQREARVASALQALAKRFPGLRVKLLCFGVADGRVSARIAAQLESWCRAEICHYSRRPAVMLRAISRCDFVLAMRLHAAIFSYALQVPFAMVDYHAKCREFCRDVRSDPRLSYPVSGPSPQQQEHLVALLSDPERHYHPPALPVDSARALAESSFREVGRYLDASGVRRPGRQRTACIARLRRLIDR